MLLERMHVCLLWFVCSFVRSFVRFTDNLGDWVSRSMALNTVKLLVVSLTFAPKPALERRRFFQIQSASQDGERERDWITVKLRMTDRWTDSHGRKIAYIFCFIHHKFKHFLLM